MSSTVSSYEQQAIDFLQKTNTTLETTFLEFGKHFDDDKQKRNIFTITLRNSKHKFSFKFGSSLNDSYKNSKDIILDSEIDFYFGLKFEGLKSQYLSYSDKVQVSLIKEKYSIGRSRDLLDKRKATTIYNEFVKANSNKHVRLNILPLTEWLDKLEGAVIRKASELATKNFGEGVQSEEIIHPTAYDVLACIQKYDVGTFDDFCSEFGYDTDSRKAYKTYKAVLREWKNIEFLFTPEQIELLREIQ